jgi:hypothetical protein
LYLAKFIPGKLTFYSSVLKSIAYVAFVHTAEGVIITIFFSRAFGVKKINEPAVTSNKLTHNFEGLATSGLGSDVASGPPVSSP